MGRNINRSLVTRAFKLVKASEKGRGLLTIDPMRPEEAVSIDGAILAVDRIENLREELGGRNTPEEDLRERVSMAVAALPFDPARIRVYELIAMSYYNLLGRFAARDNRRAQQEPAKAPKRAFRLTG